MTRLVIPAPDAFGGRVTPSTPSGVLVAVLRRHNPDADFRALKRAAESLRQNGHPDTAPQMPRERTPGRFDSDADSGGSVVSADPGPPEPVVGAERKPSRAEVEAWLARQPKHDRLVMSKSGRIPAAILAAWREAHREEVLASMVPVEGGAPMPAEDPPTEVH